MIHYYVVCLKSMLAEMRNISDCSWPSISTMLHYDLRIDLLLKRFATVSLGCLVSAGTWPRRLKYHNSLILFVVSQIER